MYVPGPLCCVGDGKAVINPDLLSAVFQQPEKEKVTRAREFKLCSFF